MPAFLNRADREESRRITGSLAARRIAALPLRPGLVSHSSNGVRSWETLGGWCATSFPVWLDGGLGPWFLVSCRGQARMASRQAAATVPAAYTPDGPAAALAEPFGARARVAQNLLKHRAVELGKHPFELRVVDASSQRADTGFQITRVQGIQVAQCFEVAGEMVSWIVHGKTSSSAGAK